MLAEITWKKQKTIRYLRENHIIRLAHQGLPGLSLSIHLPMSNIPADSEISHTLSHRYIYISTTRALDP
jgi:hypothetical protein